MPNSTNTYRLLDSGNFEKLEQVGPYRLIRPAPQAIWEPARPADDWAAAHAHYRRSSSGGGRWEFARRLPPHWTVTHYGLTLKVKLTNFGHLGLFAEQGPMWEWIQKQIRAAKKPVTVLNAFAYTGGSSLAAAAAGASVVHLDAAKGVVAWARENARLCNLHHTPIRWLVDDVSKFVAREIRRGSKYNALILDPPSFGRGAKGEVWKFERDLPRLLARCRQLLTPAPRFVLLSAHTPGFTPLALQNLLAGMMAPFRGSVTSFEMTVPEFESGRVLPSGAMARWQCKK
ncbi:MAG: class I SAM-dependent methyltransferase [Anaerolineae bacterium]